MDESLQTESHYIVQAVLKCSDGITGMRQALTMLRN